MAKLITLIILLIVAAGGAYAGVSVWTSSRYAAPIVAGVSVSDARSEALVALPIATVPYDPWYKHFGTYVDDGRFLGYHAGDDIEIDLSAGENSGSIDVPVYAIADGTVQFIDWVPGYGGVMIVKHELDGQIISSLYGHIDKDSVVVKPGDQVTKGQAIAILGEHLSEETDGRRMHLHFALWSGDEMKFPGYVDTVEELSGWLDPYQFFVEHGLLTP